MTTPLRGSCLCGQVRFAVRELAPRTAHCHCTMCRKFHGAAFATLATVKTKDFEWLGGQSLLRHFDAPNGTRRSFCGECGSSLAFHGSERE